MKHCVSFIVTALVSREVYKQHMSVIHTKTTVRNQHSGTAWHCCWSLEALSSTIYISETDPVAEPSGTARAYIFALRCVKVIHRLPLSSDTSAALYESSQWNIMRSNRGHLLLARLKSQICNDCRRRSIVRSSVVRPVVVSRKLCKINQ